MFQSFLYLWAFNFVFMCPTLCQLKTTCQLRMKQKLYALDTFFIEKLKLSENDPNINVYNRKSMHGMKLLKHNSCNQCTNKSLSILRDIQIWSFKNSLFIFELFIPHVSIRHCMIINNFYNRKSIHGMILLEHSSCHQCTNKSLSIRHSYLIKRIFRYGV